jgi:hypothetical protein
VGRLGKIDIEALEGAPGSRSFTCPPSLPSRRNGNLIWFRMVCWLLMMRKLGLRVSISEALDDRCGGHAVADAHYLEAELTVRCFEAGEHLGHEAGAGGT